MTKHIKLADVSIDFHGKSRGPGRLRWLAPVLLGTMLIMGTLTALLVTSAGMVGVVQAKPDRNTFPEYALAVNITNTVYLPLIGKCFPVASSPFSIQIAALHEMTGPYSETLKQRLAESGAEWSRVRVDWSVIQPISSTEYSWSYHDVNLTQVAEAGVKLIGTIAGTPPWADYTPAGASWPPDDPCAPIDPANLADFGQFITTLVNRYQGAPWNIHHWEIFNEPDITKPGFGQSCYGEYGAMYAEMLATAYPAIKAADPGATVLMGGLAYDRFKSESPELPFNRYFPDDVLASGGGDHMDAFNLHYFPDFAPQWQRWLWDIEPAAIPPYCGLLETAIDDDTPYEAWGIDVIAKVKHFRNRMATCLNVEKPMWITELAAHGHISDTAGLAQQARYVIQGNVRGLAAGAENITWFALVSPPYDGDDQGLLYKDDKSPKPAYTAYQTMAAELTGYTYASTRGVSDPRDEGIEAYVFAGPCGVEKTVAWYRDPAGADGSGLLNIYGVGRVRIVDRDGNETFIDDGSPGDYDASQNGSIRLLISSEPVFISAD